MKSSVSTTLDKIKVIKKSNLILVKKIMTEQIGGIHIPQRDDPTLRMAVVIDKGDGKSDEEKRAMATINKGDRLLIEKFSGCEILVDGEIYFFIDISSVQAILKNGQYENCAYC
jgi:co-chaperonin GroES (HSP10)